MATKSSPIISKHQEIQRICRLSPFELRSNKEHWERFKQLLEENITFVDSFSDPLITPSHQRLYHRREGAIKAMQTFVEESIRTLLELGIDYRVSVAVDMMKVKDSRGNLRMCHREDVHQLLDQKVREPRRLLFYKGAVFEATVNTETYSQSQLMVMIDVPSEDDIVNRVPIKLWAAPTRGLTENMMARLGYAPSKDELRSKKWTEVIVHPSDAENRLHNRRHLSACRRQYTLKHIGSSTVNKQMGNTLKVPCAIEVNPQHYPWERGQVRVKTIN